MADIHVRHTVGDQNARNGHDRAGGHNGREALVDRYRHCFPRRMEFFKIQIPAHDHDGVIDRRAHLDGGNDHVRYERSARMRQVREREVDPDAPLNDKHEDRSAGHGFEGEDQNDEHERDGEQINEQRIAVECVRQFLGARHIANNETLSFAVVSVG